MENNHKTLVSLFSDIADAIREKTETGEEIVADTFPEAIRNIQTKGIPLDDAVVTLVTGSHAYNGTLQTQAVASVVLDGTTLQEGTDYVVYNNSGTNAGTYTLVVCGIEKYSGVALANWSIAKAPLDKPTLSGSYTYNGSAKTATVNGYDAATMEQSGTVTATNAGTYSVTFAVSDATNYMWSDGSSDAFTLSWTINKAAGTISISPTSLSLLGLAGKTGSTTVTTSNAGAISAVSNAASVATASVSGKTVTVTAVKTGDGKITITAAADNNHNAVSCTLSVTATVLSKSLNDNSWAAIRQASDAGIAADIWQVGDTKDIVINGKVGATTFNNVSIKVFILGFNHNSSREGTNKIHFALGKIDDKLVSLVDSSYNSNTGTSGKFTMNTSNTNSGGWKASHMRKTVLGSDSTPTSPTANTLLAALPSDLRAIMKPITKYTDNVAYGSGNVAANVTATTDYLPLLAEYEVFGSNNYANSYEKTYQAQYDYFKAGNSKIGYKHSATGTAVWRWLRSPYYYDYYFFCYVYTDGSYYFSFAYYSAGVTAAFAA